MLKKTGYKLFFSGLLIIFFGTAFVRPVLAYEIQDIPNAPVANDFALGPGKMEIFLDPGTETEREIAISNRLGKTMNFKVEIEDFRGSRDLRQTIVLLGQEKGPYSLKDYIHPEISKFSLMHGQRMLLPIKISIPPDAEPGGLYGSVIITTVPPKSELASEQEKAKGQVSIVTRLGSLLFVRVSGDAKEDGLLKSFSIQNEKRFYEKTPLTFEVLFENNGSTHLTPYGVMEVTNMMGRKVDEVMIDPWFVMPDSLRLREFQWDKKPLFGKYTATIGVNRGYEDTNVIDEMSLSFWIIPWKIILAGVIILIILALILRWIVGTFEIRKK